MIRERKWSGPTLRLLGIATIAMAWIPSGVRGEDIAAKDEGQSVRLRWLAPAGSGADTEDMYAIWRCAGAECSAPTLPIAPGGPWKEVARVTATNACASTPCSEVIHQAESLPVSYFVTTVRGALTSDPSNIKTLDPATPIAAQAQR